MRRSKLNLVDLAGSERVRKTQVDGTILREAQHINLSLHHLEQVIIALQVLLCQRLLSRIWEPEHIISLAHVCIQPHSCNMPIG